MKYKFLKKDFKKYSDEELMSFVVRNNEEAFNELYHRYCAKLFAFFLRMFYNDTDKAKDFLQDLFIKIIEKSDTYNQQYKLKTWIYTLASNMCKNEFRNINSKGSVINNFNFDSIVTDGNIQIIDTNDSAVFNKRLEKEISLLSDEYSLTFILRYQQDLSYKEIAEIMQCPEGTVKSRIFYILKTLSVKLCEFNPKNSIEKCK
jgi:RNA polymerase sigma-70 factor (ECF subfamily)